MQDQKSDSTPPAVHAPDETLADVPENPFVSEVEQEVIRIGPVTIALIAICVGVALYSSLGNDQVKLLPLFIGLTRMTDFSDALLEVRGGQIWRLFTPMFIHFGVLHLIFNMIWLKDFGTAIEHRQRSAYFLVLVLILSLVSNLAQFYANGPDFGGMSGVVYGLFGYVWLHSVFDPQSGYRMPTQTVTAMLVWFVLCVVGIIGHVANVAHGAGLVAGCLLGFVAAKLSPTSPGPA